MPHVKKKCLGQSAEQKSTAEKEFRVVFIHANFFDHMRLFQSSSFSVSRNCYFSHNIEPFLTFRHVYAFKAVFNIVFFFL